MWLLIVHLICLATSNVPWICEYANQQLNTEWVYKHLCDYFLVHSKLATNRFFTSRVQKLGNLLKYQYLCGAAEGNNLELVEYSSEYS